MRANEWMRYETRNERHERDANALHEEDVLAGDSLVGRRLDPAILARQASSIVTHPEERARAQPTVRAVASSSEVSACVTVKLMNP